MIAARADLFQGRPFVVVPHEETLPDAVSVLKGLATEIGSVPIVLDAGDEFAAVLPGFSIAGLLVQSVVSYILGLAAVWVFGKVVQALGPRFGGTGRRPLLVGRRRHHIR